MLFNYYSQTNRQPAFLKVTCSPMLRYLSQQCRLLIKIQMTIWLVDGTLVAILRARGKLHLTIGPVCVPNAH